MSALRHEIEEMFADLGGAPAYGEAILVARARYLESERRRSALRRARRPTPASTLEDIESTVAAWCGVSVEALRGRSKRRPVARARALVMYVAVKLRYTTPRIGRHFGRHAATVAHAVALVGRLVAGSGGLARAITEMIAELARRPPEREWR